MSGSSEERRRSLHAFAPAGLLASAGAAVLLQQSRGRPFAASSALEAVMSAPPDLHVVPQNRALVFAKDVASGTVAGIAVTLVGHPFDTLKVLLQTQSHEKPVYSGVTDAFKARALCGAATLPCQQLSSATQKTLASDGLGGLYKGVAAPLVGQMFFRAALFFTVARTKELFNASPENLLGFAAAGSVAWGVASLAESPIDFFKSQMQKQLIDSRQNPGTPLKFTSMADALRRSIALNGVLGPYQGFSATLLRNLPAAGLYFGTFETLKLKLPVLTGDDKPTMAHLFVAGGAAGLAYWTFFYPLDVIKSAMQTDAMAKGDRKYRSVASTVSLLWKEGGVNRFYKGVSPCLLRAIPANAIMLMVNTRVRAMLD